MMSDLVARRRAAAPSKVPLQNDPQSLQNEHDGSRPHTRTIQGQGVGTGKETERTHRKDASRKRSYAVKVGAIVVVFAGCALTASVASVTVDCDKADPDVHAAACAAAAVAGSSASSDALQPEMGRRQQSQQKQQQRQEQQPSQRRRRTDRFPRFGTAEYAEECGWTSLRTEMALNAPNGPNEQPDCTILVRPLPTSGEGIATWFAEIAMAYVGALQVGCRIMLDYGPDVVEVERVFSPPGGRTGVGGGTSKSQSLDDWIVPRGFDCKEEDGCFALYSGLSETYLRQIAASVAESRSKRGGGVVLPSSPPKNPLCVPPHYRFGYNRNSNVTDAINTLGKVLPGFRYETGMACALGSLLDLSPSASEFVPSLFTDILPAVRDDNAFVITVYIRSGRTDIMARQEEKGDGKGTANDNHRIKSSQFDENLVNCALQVEKDNLSSGQYSHSVWLIVTDSPFVGQAVVASYDGRNVTNATGHRRVVTTAAQGVQTRPSRGPSTVDFADGAIDWYLIGESDVVVTHGSTSFSATGALRTARPLYTAMKGECRKRDLDIDGTATFEGYVVLSVKPGVKQTIGLLEAHKATRAKKKKKKQQIAQIKF